MPDLDPPPLSATRPTAVNGSNGSGSASAPKGSSQPQADAAQPPAGGGGSGGDGGTGSGGNGGEDAGSGGNNPGNIVDLQIERELQDSYLTYAMSTIMDRALPDVRDGLKPSQRRLLVAMDDLRLYPGRKHMKCSKIVGDAMGNYHPHGDLALYGTLVGMAQRWRIRVPLVDPQGNFGSLDGDAPASMRYTEARLMVSAADMLEDIKLDTVDYQPNYDDRLTEPTVLPGKFPNLLVNGGMGIAVGMATSLASHNVIEVLDSIVRVLENPDIELMQLMADVTGDNGAVVRRGIKGPDFPTGGLIFGRRGIIEAYATGRGKVTLRGKVHIEPIPGSRDRQQIVIDEVPYGLNQETLVQRIRDAVEEERIKDVSDARNESGREAQSRVVVELKKGVDPAVVENQLYQFTPLQMTFSIHNIALVNRQPRTLSLIEMIKYYIDHRFTVIRRRTAHLLAEARKRAHVLEGMIYAVCDIDEVIRTIRSSQTRAEAIDRLMEKKFQIPNTHPFAPKIPDRLMRLVRLADGRGGVSLSRIQAETICNMRLAQLVGLEIERLVEDYRVLALQIEDYEDILAKRERINAMIKADCEEMRARYGPMKAPVLNAKQGGKITYGDRLTEIQDAAGEGDINIEALIQVEDMAVTISNQGYAKRVAMSTYRQQGRGGKGIIGGAAKDEDFIEHMFVASTHDDLMCFTNTGRVFKIKVYELPELPRTSKGRPIVNLIELREGERVRAFLNVKNFEAGSNYLTFVSSQGIVKRTPLKDYRNVNKSGLIAVGLKDGDSVLDVCLTSGTDDILLATAEGMAIRFNEDDVRVMGRPAAGVKGIELADGDQVVGVVAVPMKPDADGDLMTADPSITLLTIGENGYGKRTAIDEYRVAPETGKMRSQSRGGKGRVDIDANERNGRSVAALGVKDVDDVVVTTRSGMTVRMPVTEIRTTGRGAQGVRVTKLDEGDKVVAAAPVAAGE